VPSPFQPHTHENDPHGEFIEQLVRTINETSDAQFRDVIAEHSICPASFDTSRSSRLLRTATAFSGMPAWPTSTLYRFSNSHRFVILPWDKSEAFKPGYDYHIFHNITDVPETDQNQLMRRLMSYPDLLTLYLDALQECARAVGSPTADGPGWMEGEGSAVAQIRGRRWTIRSPFRNDDFEAAVDAA
jgi:hypothetical protein